MSLRDTGEDITTVIDVAILGGIYVNRVTNELLADKVKDMLHKSGPTIYRSRKGLTVKTYKYSVTSAEHTDTDKFPSAKFSYQISPMAVVMSEKSTPLYEFLTRSCAIVGGLFTVFSLLNAAADVTIRRFKGSIGKAA